ncbi:MAG: hypothetical protein KDI03_13995 [Anaerolineae bacterium]|nr:hypothetical protein [Anaerolineae bacterium]
MRLRTILTLALTLGLLLPAVAAAAPTPSALAGPCAPGQTYDPACDVDHDGDVDVMDVQLSAGHWNQSGTWMSDNDHDHLGQTWVGSNNPLKIGGSFGAPDYAALVLANGSGSGLSVGAAAATGVYVGSAGGTGLLVSSAGADGVFVDTAGNTGVSINSAGTYGVNVVDSGSDGIHVCRAGSADTCGQFSTNNGVEIGSAEHHGVFVSDTGGSGVVVNDTNGNGLWVVEAVFDGLRVDDPGNDGVSICRAGNATQCFSSSTNNGVEIGSAQDHGVRVIQAGSAGLRVDTAGGTGVYLDQIGGSGMYVENATNDGLHVNQAGQSGVYVGSAINGINVNSASNWAATFGGNVNISGTCTGCLLAQMAINAGGETLEPGDAVAIDGIDASPFGGQDKLLRVRRATPGSALVGVVSGRAEPYTSPEDGANTLVPRNDEPAAPGEYLSVVIYGPVQVKAAGELEVGQRVTADDTGEVRAMRRVEVEGVTLDEGGPSLGMVLDIAKDGLVWVLVNPQ